MQVSKVRSKTVKASMSNWKQTLALRAFGLLKVPAIFFVRPTVVRLTDEACEVRIPLNRRTKNHWGSMYFGVLAIGADCAGGLMTIYLSRKNGQKVSLIFKGFKAEFLKRPEGDTHFICKDGALIRKLIREAVKKKKRVNHPITIIATTPKKTGNEPVAKFELILSLKAQ